jgi:hypothetical protein
MQAEMITHQTRILASCGGLQHIPIGWIKAVSHMRPSVWREGETDRINNQATRSKTLWCFVVVWFGSFFVDNEEVLRTPLGLELINSVGASSSSAG